jgi:CheY-like chemotaxis protein
LFSQALNSRGINAIAFADPVVAIDYLINHHLEISLIILDWRMPRMNGLELARIVQQTDNEIKIMIMSAYDLDIDDLKKIEKKEYLRKPMEVGKLIDAIKKELIKPVIIRG